MTKSILSNTLVLLVAITLICGCAGLGSGTDDKELINATLSKWKGAIESANIETLAETFSGNYGGEETGKTRVVETFENYISAGYLDNAEVNIDASETTIEENQASITNVGLTAAAGTFKLEFGLQKEEGSWLITKFSYEESF